MKFYATCFLACCTLVLSMSTGAYAGGKELFQNRCGACHRAGGEGPVFAPAKFASIQWARFFERNRHANYKDIGNLLSQAEVNDVKQYLMEHAADSDRPEAVGLRAY